jgi:hypothetical protein
MHPWLSRLRHDLVKRAVWAARDLRDASRLPKPADFAQLRRGMFELRDGEGQPVTALELWQRLCSEAPPIAPAALDSFAAALDSFAAALAAAERDVANLAVHPDGWRDAVEAVLRIEPAFANLARTLEEE